MTATSRASAQRATLRQRLRKQLGTVVWHRAGGRCEVCGHRIPSTGFHLHHRRPRGMGGSRLLDTWSAANCLATCWQCNTDKLERFRLEAKENGWVIGQLQDPTQIPVKLHDGRRVLLTVDGTYQEVEAA